MTAAGSPLARALVDAADRLVSADEPLAGLQLRCGGELPGTIATPALIDLVRKARSYGLKLGRVMRASDGQDAITAWIEIEPQADGACQISLRSWNAVPLPPEDTKENLGSVVNILSAIAERLKNRDSQYAAVFETLVETAARKPDLKAVESALQKASGAAYDLEKLDAEWEEQFAFENTEQTTGQNSGCPKAEDMLARINGYKEEERVKK